jgi:hypothetical protein
MAQLGANAHGEIFVSGRVPDRYLGLLLDPPRDQRAGSVLVVASASLLHPCVPQPGGTLLYQLVTGHPDRAPHELVAEGLAHEMVAQQQGRVAEGLRPAGLGEQPLTRADLIAEHAEPQGSPAFWRLLVVHASNNTAPARSVSFSGRRG